MKEFKGTKGEWKVCNGDTSMVLTDSGAYRANAMQAAMCSSEELASNAKLIAAAPNLLKELQKIKLDIELGVIPVRKSSPTYKGVESAINKALSE